MASTVSTPGMAKDTSVMSLGGAGNLPCQAPAIGASFEQQVLFIASDDVEAVFVIVFRDLRIHHFRLAWHDRFKPDLKGQDIAATHRFNHLAFGRAGFRQARRQRFGACGLGCGLGMCGLAETG
ncbi:hypothetical protein G6F65_020851 [Rhizopus arrhizus]|nr:hypothetical protein G6F65_020851 [Rhizopus arrhizus]